MAIKDNILYTESYSKCCPSHPVKNDVVQLLTLSLPVMGLNKAAFYLQFFLRRFSCS